MMSLAKAKSAYALSCSLILRAQISMVQEPLFYFNVFSIKLSIALGNQWLTRMIYSRAWETLHWTFIGVFLCLLPICNFLKKL